MERKASDGRIVGVLIVLLVIEGALLGVHLKWGGFRQAKASAEALLAGHVVSRENELRRRGTNSLVWEKSTVDDSVYYYDSILTLAQSTASLKLSQETEVRLSENTLVTIEPQDKKGFGEIRLKFVRGSLKARNPFTPAEMSSDTWTMEIKSGSEIDFRQVNDGQFELNVQKGEVDFNSAEGQEKVTGSEMLRIQNDKPVKMQVEEALQWIHPPAERIYTHNETARVHLEWQAADGGEIRLQTVGAPEQVMALQPGEHSRDLDLPFGKHRLYLRSGTKTSQASEVEVWKAPLLHLLAPLPRNRVRTNEAISFLWMTVPGVISYNFLVNGQTHEKLEQNNFSTSFSDEEDIQWSVQGLDAQGFAIPPLYSYPLYIREAPLAAPKLKAPSVRRPAANDGAGYWLQRIILPEAQAEESQYQAVFNWEPVPGADRYVIEISESADFRTPLVNKTVGKNEFMWKKMELKTYYWRVAAETKKGRLGIFSEPQSVNLNESDSTVAVTRLVEPSPPPAKPPEVKAPEPVVPEPVVVVAPTPPLASPAPVEPKPEFKMKPQTYVEWRPGYTQTSLTAAKGVNASFQGQNLTSFSAGTDYEWNSDQMIRLELDYLKRDYRPQPATKYPLQDNLSWSEFSGLAISHFKTEHWGYGLFFEQSAQIESQTLETVKAVGTLYAGPCAENYYQWGNARYIGDYMFAIGSQSGPWTRQNLRQTLWPKAGLYLGVGIEAAALFGNGGHTYPLTGQLSLGFDF